MHIGYTHPWHARLGTIAIAILLSVVAVLSCLNATVTMAHAADTTDYTYSADPRQHSWTQLDQNTFTMDTDGDGKPDITLVKNGDTWTYTFDVEDASRNYYVYEEMFNGLENQGYTSKGSDGTSALPNDPGQTGVGTKTYTITNSKEHATQKTGSLKISKTVVASNPDLVNAKSGGWDVSLTYDGTDHNSNNYNLHEYNINEEELQKEFENQANSSKQSSDIHRLVSLRQVDDNTSTSTSPTSPALSRKFAFTVKLTASDTTTQKLIDGQKIFGSVPFVDGVATVSLGNGESITMSDIPVGVTYTVTETAVDGYAITKTGNTGTIADGVTSEAAFTNTYTPLDDLDSLSVKVAKTVTGSPKSASDVYTAHFMVTDAAAGTILTTSTGATATVASDGTADIPLQLKDGSSVSVDGIPVGAHYKVTEDGGDWYASYTVVDSSASTDGGSIASDANSSDKTDTPLSTGEETAESGENVTITFTNKIHKVQTITLKKVVKDSLGNVVTNDNDKNGKAREYTVEMMLSGLPANTSLPSSIGTLNADDNGDIDMLAYLANGESVTIKDVPVGTKYRFIEQANSKIASYELSVANGQTGTFVSKSDKNATASTDLATGVLKKGRLGTGDEVVDANEDVTVTFTNAEPLTFHMPFSGSMQVLMVVASFVAAVILIVFLVMRQSNVSDSGMTDAQK